MALPVPNLDDRRFQDLVDDAKRLVQQRCPEWTDHNVSDPGVTLIETFAWMTDQLLYRLNRVPDRHYVKFLELIGVRLFPPIAARAAVTFWLSAPQPDVVKIAAGTQVATVRTQADEAIVFATTDDLAIVPCALARPGSIVDGKQFRDGSAGLDKGNGFLCFDTPPKPGDALMVGLSEAVPSCAITLRFKATSRASASTPTAAARLGGVGRRRLGRVRGRPGRDRWPQPRRRHRPPRPRQPCHLGDRQAAGRLGPGADRRARRRPAGVQRLAQHPGPERVHDRWDGRRGQRRGRPRRAGRRLGRHPRPALPAQAPADRARQRTGRPAGQRRGGLARLAAGRHFADSGPDDRHFVLDAAAGELLLGPGVRQEDGSFRQYGAVPPKGARLAVQTYRTGGGRQGNVAAKAINTLKSSIPYVARVENRRPAAEGSTARTSRTPRSAVRSCCAPAAGR